METASEHKEVLEAAQQYINWLRHEDIMGAKHLTPQIFFEELSNGLLLLRVIDHIYPHKVDWTKVNVPATSIFKKMDNCSLLANLCRGTDIPSEGIQAKNIAEGNSDSILKILWLLMRQSFIVLRGAKTEDDIKKMAMEFTGVKRAEVEPDILEPDVLWIVPYYGIEGEVFAVFCDEEELNCERLPNNFSRLIKPPLIQEATIDRHENQNTRIKRSTKKESTSLELRDPSNLVRSNRIDVVGIDTTEKHINQKLEAHQTSILTPSSQNFISMRLFFSQRQVLSKKSRPRKRMLWYELLEPLAELEEKVQTSLTISMMKADDLEHVSFLPLYPTSDSGTPKKSSTGSFAPRLSNQNSLDKNHYKVLDSILLENLSREDHRKKSGLERQLSSDGHATFDLGAFSGKSLHSSKSKLSGQPTFSNGSDHYSRSASMPVDCPIMADDLRHFANVTEANGSESKRTMTSFKTQPLLSAEDAGSDPRLMESEVIDDFDWSCSLHIFNGYASILRGVKTLIRDKQLQRRSQLDNFSVKNTKSIPFYLRCSGNLNSDSLMKVLKTHQRFAPNFYHELFDHNLDRSEMVDVRSVQEKLAMQKQKVLKVLSRLGSNPSFEAAVMAARSVGELKLLKESVPKTGGVNTTKPRPTIAVLLERRLKTAIDSPAFDLKAPRELTPLLPEAKDYIDPTAFRALATDDKRRFYQSAIIARLNRDPDLRDREQRSIGAHLQDFAAHVRRYGPDSETAFVIGTFNPKLRLAASH